MSFLISNFQFSLAGRNCEGDIAHDGQKSRVMYMDLAVAAPNECKSETQYATCNDGTFGAWRNDPCRRVADDRAGVLYRPHGVSAAVAACVVPRSRRTCCLFARVRQ